MTLDSIAMLFELGAHVAIVIGAARAGGDTTVRMGGRPALNVAGPFLCARGVLPTMRNRE
jgi:hypothetical protein